MGSWFVDLNGKAVGPISAAEVHALLGNGQVTPRSLVWQEGMEAWCSLEQTALRLSAALPLPDDIFGDFWTRAVAAGMDSGLFLLFTSVCALVSGFVLGFALSFRGFQPEQAQRIARFFGLLLTIGSIAFYYGILPAALAGTPGKLICGLRLVRHDLRPLSVLRACFRIFAIFLASLPFGAGLLLVVFHRHKRGMHDLIAGTVVVTKEGLQRQKGAAVPPSQSATQMPSPMSETSEKKAA